MLFDKTQPKNSAEHDALDLEPGWHTNVLPSQAIFRTIDIIFFYQWSFIFLLHLAKNNW